MMMMTENDNDTLEDIAANVDCPADGATTEDDKSEEASEKQAPALHTTVDAEIEVFDRIANKLLRSGLLLTALELHAELIERGKELPRLREFFDNPQNFESASGRQELSVPMAKSAMRSPESESEQTFDSSIDFTHYSDDIERPGDERVAVLEFELRKAQQTINTLRASLTMSTTVADGHLDDESELLHAKSFNPSDGTVVHSGALLARSLTDSSSDRGSADGQSCLGESDLKLSQGNSLSSADVFETQHESSNKPFKYSLSSIKPHELRAINYLVNEYLLATNYKITAITFCDENADQDFEKWEDVGLNTDRPPDLLRLYRSFWQNRSSLLRSNSNATTILSGGTAATITTIGAKAPNSSELTTEGLPPPYD